MAVIVFVLTVIDAHRCQTTLYFNNNICISDSEKVITNYWNFTTMYERFYMYETESEL